jgi:hypothetical protein
MAQITFMQVNAFPLCPYCRAELNAIHVNRTSIETKGEYGAVIPYWGMTFSCPTCRALLHIKPSNAV